MNLRRLHGRWGAPVLCLLALAMPVAAESEFEAIAGAQATKTLRSPTRVRRQERDPLQALEWAAAMAPGDAQAQLAHGNALREARRPRDAAGAYARATAADPTFAAAHFNLGLALRDSACDRESILAFREAARLDPMDFEAVQCVVGGIARAVRSGAVPLFERERRGIAEADPGPVSIVTCSIDPERLARFEAALRPHVAGLEHELIVIRDARSLCEGYARGVAMSRYATVVLMHDDVAFVSPRPFHALGSALERHDVVGVAGSRVASGPAVLWAGHPHIHGWVSYPARESAGYEAWPLSLESGVLGGMQTLDGLLLAMRRDTAKRIGFDARTFDGFHFYDLDFCVRAHAAGCSLAVTTEVLALHDSAGDFGDEWRRYAARFAAKHPGLNAPRGTAHAYLARFARVEELQRFHRELAALAGTT